MKNRAAVVVFGLFCALNWSFGEELPKPYSAPCVERENVFEFTEKPKVKDLGNDKYEITFAVKGFCDVTVAIADERGKVVRHLASGVLGANAPAPFQKDSLRQTIQWNGKDDLDFYHKEPEKLRVRVSLGLKPTFNRLLGWSPYDSTTWDIGGDIRAYQAMVADETGVYVMLGDRTQLRHYNHKAEYARTVIPPTADTPLARLTGYTELKIGPEQSVLHEHYMSRQGSGSYFRMVHYAHAAIENGMMFLGKGNLYDFDTIRLSDGATGRLRFPKPPGRPFKQVSGAPEFLAISPDGSRLYVSGLCTDGLDYSWGNAVFCIEMGKPQPARVFAGVPGALGTDNGHFNVYPAGIDCDAQGRVYVCDPQNRRIQVFSDQGVYLKTLSVPAPFDIRVDRRTGAIYVLEVFEGGGGGRRMPYNPQNWNGPRLSCGLTRLRSFEAPEVTAALEIPNPPTGWGGRSGPLFALDYRNSPVRIWISGDHFNLRVFEDRGDSLVPYLDFNKEVEKSGQMPFMMKCGPMLHDTAEFVTADPRREQVYLYSWQGLAMQWDLRTGKPTRMHFPSHSWTTPRAFDAKGYVYGHLNACITRHDPDDGFREVPLDYGEEPPPCGGDTHVGKCVGVIPLKDQGYDGHTGGIGVNMRGDMAVVSAIAYVPRFEEDDSVRNTLRDSRLDQLPTEESGSSVYVVLAQGAGREYRLFQNEVAAAQKRGETLYSVKRDEGRILAGSTIWVFDSRGERRSEDIIQGLGQARGIEIDEDGCLYTVFGMRRMTGSKPFLADRLSVIGADAGKPIDYPTATLMKTSPQGAKVCSKHAPVPMNPWPDRPMEVEDGWVEGASWLYAGAAHVQTWGPRHALDWHKRCFVPENYRHSVGILDMNGNVIMHMGRYGNADSGRGPDSPVKVGEDEIAFSYIHGVSATDNYLCVGDFGNLRIVALKPDYHAQEEVPIGAWQSR